MKQSLRAKRMAKHHRRLNQGSKLNLVALMDIFTLLVFFLLVNSSGEEVLQTEKSIKLPVSVADTVPETHLVVMVSATEVLVGGQRIGAVNDILASGEERFAPLETELKYLAGRARALTEEEKLVGRSVTIMGDQDIPYALLKKIMASCAAADYRNISLAVSQTEQQPDATGS